MHASLGDRPHRAHRISPPPVNIAVAAGLLALLGPGSTAASVSDLAPGEAHRIAEGRPAREVHRLAGAAGISLYANEHYVGQVALHGGSFHDPATAHTDLAAAPEPVSGGGTVVRELPDGSQSLPFENLEGVILIQARIQSETGRDTSGIFVFDTGAGHLAIDYRIAQLFEMIEVTDNMNRVEVARRPLQRLEIGHQQIDQLSPVLVIDAEVVRRVADRPVLGLIGQRSVAHEAVVIDYRSEELTLIPVSGVTASDSSRVSRSDPTSLAHSAASVPESEQIASSRAALGDSLTRLASAVPFELAGDGRIVLSARATSPRSRGTDRELTLILDTGATKTVLFEEGLREIVPGYDRWPTLSGLSAPTLLGSAEARLARVPQISLESSSGTVVGKAVDVAILQNELGPALARDVGRPVHGLLGYSFLRRFRVIIDYPHRVLWLEPVPHGYDDRPFEYTHVGIQIERREAGLVVAGLGTGSPAARAGIRRGDVIVAIDGTPAAELDVISASRLLEGPPRSRVRLVVNREGETRTFSLTRRRLL